MIPISTEFVRSLYYMLTDNAPSGFPFVIFGMSILMIILLILSIGYFPKYRRFTSEHLYCDTDVIAWSDLDHVRLKQSEWGNPYLAFYFKDERSPKSFDIERISNAGGFVDTIKEKAAEKGFTFSADHHVELKGEIQPEGKGLSEVKSYMVSWLLFIAVLVFMYAIFFAFLGGKPFYRYFPLATLLFACLALIYISGEIILSKESDKTEKHLIIGMNVILWSDLEHIRLKKSEYGNPYLAFYFKDERSPKSFDIEHFSDAKEFVDTLRERAAEEGVTFSAERNVALKGEICPWFETLSELKYRRLRERERKELEENKEWREESVQRSEETRKSKEKPEIKISPRQKTLLMISLAVFFFLGIIYVFGIKAAFPLFLVILVHEMGHLIALKAFHIKVHGLFFIPFVGAGVLPKEEFPSPSIEATVALAGPAVGLSLNLTAYIMTPRVLTLLFNLNPSIIDVILFIQIPSLILMNMILNLVNLAPILPLDGGRIVRAALLRGRKSLISVAVVTIGSGVAVGLYFEDIILLVIVVLGFGSLIYSYKRMEKKEVEPPAWWKSVVILGAWIAVIFLYLCSFSVL